MGDIGWTDTEDRICCKAVLNEYILKENSADINNLIDEIKRNSAFDKRSEGAIRMRLQNIKSFLDNIGVKNTIPLKPLSNYADQTKRIMTEELQKAGIEISGVL